MGIRAPAGVGDPGTPPAGDQANGVLTGTFKAVGPSNPFAFWGPFNVAIWANIVHTLTTVAGSLAATVDSTASLVVGQGIVGANIPPGTTIGALPGGNNVTLALPPNANQAAIKAGADAAAVFNGIAWGGGASVQLERSFDGGTTWLVCGVGGSGQQAVWAAGTTVSVVAGEPENAVLYRLNCTVIGANNINYRLSTTGGGAIAWAPAVN